MTQRGRWRSNARLIAPVVVGAIVISAAAASVTRSSANFVASTGNAGSNIGAGTLVPPTALGGSASGPSVVDLTWTPTVSTIADGYNLYRSLRSGSGYVFTANVPGQPTANYTDSGAQPGSFNHYVAEATAGAWVSGYSNEATTLTPGLPGPQPGGPWGTGLTHAADPGVDRGLIFIVGNEQDPHVRQLGSWGTGLTHAAEPGTERVLVFIGANEDNGTGGSPSISSVTYGGQSLTNVNGVRTGTGTPVRIEMWVLDEAGIAAATDSTFVPTWSNTPTLPMYSHAFFAGVDQTTPIADEDTARTNNGTPNPITTNALNTTPGYDYVVTGAVAGTTGAYTPQNGFTLGNNQNAGAEATLGTATKRALAATETPSMLHSGPNKQAITGAVLNASAVPYVPTVTSVTYGGQPLTKLTGVSTGSPVTAATEIWFLDEAGIAAAADATFVPTWDTPPDLPSYAHRFYTGIDQTDPIGDTDVGASPAATPNPITTPPLTTVAGDVVVTGAFSGNAGTYTPQNGFTFGTNQNNGSTTLGTADKFTGAASETPSMQHSGPNRQVISGVVLQRRRAAFANGWTTGLTHAAGSGSDRILLFLAGMENGADPGTPPQGLRDLTGVTYGGQALTPAGEVHICTAGATSSFCARTELWYLLEAGIAAAAGTTFVPTWTGDPPYELEEFYAAVTIERVNQTAPLGNLSTNTSTLNPIQPADPIGVGTGDIAIVAVMGGMQGSYTPPGTYTEATDQTLLSSTFATAFLEVATDGSQQPSMSFDAVINRQVLLAATIKTNGTP
ncbi:MAG: hypothetical protein HKN44_08140 [Ilumatobacter sp.]|nr:hypothetical protein [Ilumatobacter sp.]